MLPLPSLGRPANRSLFHAARHPPQPTKRNNQLGSPCSRTRGARHLPSGGSNLRILRKQANPRRTPRHSPHPYKRCQAPRRRQQQPTQSLQAGQSTQSPSASAASFQEVPGTYSLFGGSSSLRSLSKPASSRRAPRHPPPPSPSKTKEVPGTFSVAAAICAVFGIRPVRPGHLGSLAIPCPRSIATTRMFGKPSIFFPDLPSPAFHAISSFGARQYVDFSCKARVFFLAPPSQADYPDGR